MSILEYFFSHLTFLVLWSLSIYFSWDSSIILEDLLFHHLFLSGPETAERKMLTTQALSHTWLFLCYSYPLWAVYDLRRVFLNEIVFPVWMREVAFPKFIDKYPRDDFRISLSHLTFLVLLPFVGLIYYPRQHLCSYQALRRLEERCWPPRHSHLISLVLHSLLYSYPCGSYIISDYFLRNCISCLHERSCIDIIVCDESCLDSSNKLKYYYQALRRLWDYWYIWDRQNGKEGVEKLESIDVICPRSPPCIRLHGSRRTYIVM